MDNNTIPSLAPAPINHSNGIGRLAILRSVLEMEMHGMKVSNRTLSAYTLIKRDYAMSGSKASILEQVDAIIARGYL